MKTNNFLIMLTDRKVVSLINLTEEDELSKINFMRKIKGDVLLDGQRIVLNTFLSKMKYNGHKHVYELYEVNLPENTTLLSFYTDQNKKLMEDVLKGVLLCSTALKVL